ncbi:helix-turn-helix domain-containing protein [Yersinia enterocolitica]|uniref:helix-turn-helix domain-containing protein n=1 Tax=Yersinia enterocolitica TaxID=630 RepID=UPI0011159521|nr:helix-turn-helix domain-containing protein [Yersinia enterocolitica]ELI7922727.1 helix-turn-helix domain-containing protein [Yersinia enterocolitica]
MRVWVMESERCIYGFKGMVCLTDKEYRLFSSLLKKGCNGNVLSRDELISDVWPERHGVIGKNDIHQLSFRLRKKLIVINEGFKVGLVDGSGFSIHRPQSIIVSHLEGSSILTNLLKIFYKIKNVF